MEPAGVSRKVGIFHSGASRMTLRENLKDWLPIPRRACSLSERPGSPVGRQRDRKGLRGA